jgi:hypothetical protein
MMMLFALMNGDTDSNTNMTWNNGHTRTHTGLHGEGSIHDGEEEEERRTL